MSARQYSRRFGTRYASNRPKTMYVYLVAIGLMQPAACLGRRHKRGLWTHLTNQVELGGISSFLKLLDWEVVNDGKLC